MNNVNNKLKYPTKVVGVSIKEEKEFEANFHVLQGSTVTTMLVIKHTDDAALITKSITWLVGSFNALPTCLDQQDNGLMFLFMRGFIKDEYIYRQLKLKIVSALRKHDYDESTIVWFMQDVEL